LAYKATNRRREQFVQQLVVCRQVANLLNEGERRVAAAELNDAAASASATHCRRPEEFPLRSTAGQLARDRELSGLCAALSVPASKTLFYCNSMSYGSPSVPRQGHAARTIRAAASLNMSPRNDWLQYRGADGTMQQGQAALIVQSRAGRRPRVVVRRAQEVPPRVGCVLSDYGCQRLG